jgi:glycosyltransferase involved in cell wall biosynthesis
VNLLILIHSLNSGGAERVTANLANYWVKQGWRITVVTLASREQDFYDLHPAVRRIALDMAGESRAPYAALRNNLRRIVALRRVLREIRPDVSVGMMSTAGVLLVMAALRLPKCSTIISERTYPPMMPLGPMWRRLRRWTYPLADKVIMLTTEGLAWLKEEIPRARGVVIPNAIPFPLPMSEPKLMPDSVIKPGRRLLLAVGRLSEEKRFDLLLKVFSSLLPANPDWDLVILGEGPLRPVLESQVRALGLQGRVLLPGRVGNVGDWYLRADFYVMSSRFEGFPNTLGEAMAHGCAAVSFDCDTGPRDIIRHEVDGLLVPNGDIGSLECALGRLMMDSATRQRLASRATEVRGRFSLEMIADSWMRLFVEVVR